MPNVHRAARCGILLLTLAGRAAAHGPFPCSGGVADLYSCERVDLAHHLSLSSLGASSGSDLWGWTDPESGRELALFGHANGVSFVEVTDPEAPVHVGDLPRHAGASATAWADLKTYGHYLYVVKDYAGAHGLQVFDLEQLLDVTLPPVTFTETAHYAGFGSAHNLAIDEVTGFAAVLGVSSLGSAGTDCSSGLFMLDLSVPTAPSFAGCYSGDGYTHDAQCVVYSGPDADWQGAEICLAANEDTLTVVDVSNKSLPALISRTGYPGRGYAHQGWLTEDQRHFLLDDESDESTFGHNTRTRVWDVTDLDAPSIAIDHLSTLPASDHNLYVRGDYAFQANYKGGLRILDLSAIESGNLEEVAHFDTFPASDAVGFDGAWSTYPFFPSGTVIVGDISNGLFVLSPRLCPELAAAEGLTATGNGDQRIDLDWSGILSDGESWSVFRGLGECPGSQTELLASGVAGSSFSDLEASGQVTQSYTVVRDGDGALCHSPASGCASATTSGACTAPPLFSGLDDVSNLASLGCGADLEWAAATASCGGSLTYSVYRSSLPDFVPQPGDRIASGISGSSWTDLGVPGTGTWHYVVRATDSGSGAEDGNLVRRAVTTTGPLSDGTWSSGAEAGDPALDTDSGDGLEARIAIAHAGWHLSTARAHSGDRSFFSQYADGLCSSLTTPAVVLTAGEASQLTFWTAFDIESQYDGGVVEASTDDGLSWATVQPSPGYPGTFNNSQDACGYPSGQPSFTGSDLDWRQHQVDLSAWNGGPPVRLRWRFSTDPGLTREGWYVDELAISHAQTAASCVGGGIFADGFESGDTSRW